MGAALLLHGSAAQHEAESPLCIDVDGPLQIQFIEANRVLDGLRAALLGYREMNLAILEPVIGHVIDRAVSQIELRQAAPLSVIALGRISVRWRCALTSWAIVRRIGSKTIPIPIGRRPVAVESPAPIIGTPVRPPKGIESTSKPVKGRAKEHLMVKNVSPLMLRVESVDACPRRSRTGKASRPQHRCMRSSRSKYVRRAPGAPTAEMAAACIPATAYVASAHVAATALGQCNRSSNAGESQC